MLRLKINVGSKNVIGTTAENPSLGFSSLPEKKPTKELVVTEPMKVELDETLSAEECTMKQQARDMLRELNDVALAEELRVFRGEVKEEQSDDVDDADINTENRGKKKRRRGRKGKPALSTDATVSSSSPQPSSSSSTGNPELKSEDTAVFASHRSPTTSTNSSEEGFVVVKTSHIPEEKEKKITMTQSELKQLVMDNNKELIKSLASYLKQSSSTKSLVEKFESHMSIDMLVKYNEAS